MTCQFHYVYGAFSKSSINKKGSVSSIMSTSNLYIHVLWVVRGWGQYWMFTFSLIFWYHQLQEEKLNTEKSLPHKYDSVVGTYLYLSNARMQGDFFFPRKERPFIFWKSRGTAGLFASSSLTLTSLCESIEYVNLTDRKVNIMRFEKCDALS